MKATGVVRRIDDLGRIVIPKEVRKTMRIKEGDSLEIFVESDDKIIFKKYSPVQNINDFIIEYVDSVYSSTKKEIIVTDNEQVIAASSNFKKDIIGKRLSIVLTEKLTKRSTQVIDAAEAIEITDSNIIKKAAIIKPILVYGDIIGAVIVYGTKEIGEIEKNISDLSAQFISRYLEG